MKYLDFLEKADEYRKQDLLNMLYDMINLYDISMNDMIDYRHKDLAERIKKMTEYNKFGAVHLHDGKEE